ncbi:hypothetical protein DFJ58DRAFT_849591 [Suillus subalutaceus]|uniref:uncharacterized protein n=1 Tax=Suillus subalutaceus TaxID=48586 RepID=UPI001B8689F2|nr:uncharacterized protein DFJ58DRAFT_849591 [Suillus subalutaceus]KAG1825226.1 hypothetical protein DFJ58DRAFT_849591 [Suillus subalutaceus]
MAKRAASNDGAPTSKRIRIDDRNQTTPLADKHAWAILEQFLTTDMTYPQMEEALLSYLSDRYSADDWKESRDALFSGDDDDKLALANLRAVKAKHIHPASSAPKDSSMADRRSTSAHIQSSRRRARLKNPYLDLAAEDNNNNKDDDEEGGGRGRRRRRRTTTINPQSPGRFEGTQPSSSQDHQTIPTSISGLIPLAGLQDGKMYHLHVERNVTDYIAAHLWRKKFAVKVLAWLAGQLYVVADSPKTIADSLPFSLYLTIVGNTTK